MKSKSLLNPFSKTNSLKVPGKAHGYHLQVIRYYYDWVLLQGNIPNRGDKLKMLKSIKQLSGTPVFGDDLYMLASLRQYFEL